MKKLLCSLIAGFALLSAHEPTEINQPAQQDHASHSTSLNPAISSPSKTCFSFVTKHYAAVAYVQTAIIAYCMGKVSAQYLSRNIFFKALCALIANQVLNAVVKSGAHQAQLLQSKENDEELMQQLDFINKSMFVGSFIYSFVERLIEKNR